MQLHTGSLKKHGNWKTTWGLLEDIIKRMKGPSTKTNTGLPTKDGDFSDDFKDSVDRGGHVGHRMLVIWDMWDMGCL